MLHRLGLTTLIAAMAAFWHLPPAVAADHRDAPTVDEYSAIDINDLFMFRDPANKSNLVMALSTQAVADPNFAPSYHFQANALYRIFFSTNAAAKPTASIDFVFSPFVNGPSCPAPAAACQTYTARFPHGIVVEGTTVQGTVATPSTPVTCPATPTLGNSSTSGCIGQPGPGVTVFAGPREDPFFFDLVGFDRFIANFNTTHVPDTALFTGVDSFAGKNVNAIVVEFPISLVAGAATQFSAWAVTYLGDFRYDDARHFESHPEGLRQIDRMGNPAVNTALIPPPLKDAYNFGIPEDDATDFAPAILATLANYGTAKTTIPALAAAAVPDTLKFNTKNPVDGFDQVPPNGRILDESPTNFLIGLFFNDYPAFTDHTTPKKYLAKFPFLGPPLPAQ